MMQSTLTNIFSTESIFSDTVVPSIEVYMVDKNDILYSKGRILADNVYRQIWKTENLIDENDYAIVVCYKGNIVGNINLQLRPQEKLLKSERFFGAEHWKKYFNIKNSLIAELSALAICRSLPQEVSRLVMMSLIMGIVKLCCLENIQFLATVQHKCLIRMLAKNLYLPFIQNQEITSPCSLVPDDEYWNREQKPRLYYIEPLSLAVSQCCYSYLTYITLKGISTVFLPRLKITNLSYSTFFKNWNQGQQESKLVA